MWISAEQFWETLGNMTYNSGTAFACAAQICWFFDDPRKNSAVAANYAVRLGIVFG